LTDPEFNKILKEEGMLVWGGDVRDVEPYSAGLKLNATTYPFVAFIALHPARHRTPNSGSSTTQNILSILSRHAGAAETTPRALADHLREKLLPHMRPVFEKYRLEERTRQTDRLEREESERRARLAGERDVERIRRIREEDQRKAWEEKNERIRLMDMRIEEAQKRMKTAARKAYWRQVGTALGEPSTTGPRITVRLPSGKRAVRQFEETEGIGAIYAFAASQLAESLPEEGEAADTLSYDVVQDGWGFLLATSYPRVPIPWSLDSGSGISSVAGGALRNGGMLVIEMDAEESGNGATSKPGASSPSADDEYLSEED
jgi:FAS-associated factor 2